MKERFASNKIYSLHDAQGTRITGKQAVQEEVVNFYKELLGSSAPALPAIDLAVVRKGSRLSKEACDTLIAPITTHDIDEAVKSISDLKAPGLDGFNACFFKASWPMIKRDVYDAIQEFFHTTKLLLPVNCTSITLVPKVAHPSQVKEYRPIACCSLLYKIISKILTKRLQQVIHEVISPCQAGFIPGRQIFDNILIATELIKGYTRKDSSPRCMLKIDLTKAYDYVEWPLLRAMLIALGFPLKYVDWIMECVTTVSYSLLINGSPTLPFMAKKGLRQGDPLSPFLFAVAMEYLSRCMATLKDIPDFNFHPRCQKLSITHLMFADDLLLFCRADQVSLDLLFQCFTKFSAASGLAANMEKSELYIGGVHNDVKQQLSDQITIPLGSLPFRYLGVPLSSKKLTYSQCKPLISRIVERIKSWTAKKLSYAGRLQLIKSVIFGMQAFWAQIFLLPKKVCKEVDSVCRIFLWTGDVQKSKKTLVAWETICLPKFAGGLSVKHLATWNKAAIAKQMWALQFKKDKLWVQWVDIYYFKAGRTAHLPQSASWMLKKIVQMQDVIDRSGGWNATLVRDTFSIKKLYQLLQGSPPKVPWKRLMYNYKASPKSMFIMWFVLHGRLATCDRLQRWGITCPTICVLCNSNAENASHLFFECCYTQQLWRMALQMLDIHRNVLSFHDELQQVYKAARKKKGLGVVYTMLFVEVVYQIWTQRNSKVFRNTCLPVEFAFREGVYKVAYRSKENVRMVVQ